MNNNYPKYPKNKLYINSYINKKGIRKIGINLDEELAIKFSNKEKLVIDAIIFELKQDLENL